MTFSPRKMLSKCDTADKTSLHKRIVCQVDQTFLRKKKEISSGISPDHVRSIISEAVADDVQKNFFE